MEDDKRDDRGERPANDLERLILDSRAGRAPVENLLRALVAADLYVSSATEIKDDGSGFTPLLFDNQAGNLLTAVFTDPSRATAHAGRAKYLLRLKGRDLFRRLPAGYGLVINPGHPVGMEIQPFGVEAIVRDFA